MVLLRESDLAPAIERSVSAIESLEAALGMHVARDPCGRADLEAARRSFENAGLVVVTRFIAREVIAAIGAEARALLDRHALRRDFRMSATGSTRRSMRNIRQAEIATYGRAIPALYASARLRAILAEIAGEALFTCPFAEERYVVTCLEQAGDTHGWHWDDYSFALVWVVETPPPDQGGFVQCVPRTFWNKESPAIGRVLAHNKIHAHPIGSGQLYLLRSDTTLHRVYPLLAPGRRIIVNMAWASGSDLGREITHETVDALWSAPPESGSPG